MHKLNLYLCQVRDFAIFKYRLWNISWNYSFFNGGNCRKSLLLKNSIVFRLSTRTAECAKFSPANHSVVCRQTTSAAQFNFGAKNWKVSTNRDFSVMHNFSISYIKLSVTSILTQRFLAKVNLK